MGPARRLLAQTEVAYAEGMARSRRIAHQRWPEIERIARVLYARPHPGCGVGGPGQLSRFTLAGGRP